MIDIILPIAFIIFIGTTNGFIAKQLEYMKYKKNQADKGNKMKGYWHYGMFFVRLLFMLVMLLNGWQYAVFYLFLDFTFYDALIDLARGKFSCYFVGTCEYWKGGFDFDCIMIKVQKFIHIPIFCLKIILFIILNYLLWSL